MSELPLSLPFVWLLLPFLYLGVLPSSSLTISLGMRFESLLTWFRRTLISSLLYSGCPFSGSISNSVVIICVLFQLISCQFALSCLTVSEFQACWTLIIYCLVTPFLIRPVGTLILAPHGIHMSVLLWALPVSTCILSLTLLIASPKCNFLVRY